MNRLLCLLGVHRWKSKTVNHDPLDHPRFDEERTVCESCGVRKL